MKNLILTAALFPTASAAFAHTTPTLCHGALGSSKIELNFDNGWDESDNGGDMSESATLTIGRKSLETYPVKA